MTTRPVLTIGIAGGTGAGKTTLAQKLYTELGGETNVSYLVHDSYYKDLSHLIIDERIGTNFDHPQSLETSLLLEHIQALKRGEAIDVPQYDFATHTRISDQSIQVQPQKIIIIEGILILCHPELVAEMDIKVFVDADADIRFVRRLSRDIKERGRTVDDVINQYTTTVRPMHELFVEPSKQVADIIVHSTKHSLDVAIEMLVNHLRTKANIEAPTSSTTSTTIRESSTECDTPTGTSGEESIAAS